MKRACKDCEWVTNGQFNHEYECRRYAPTWVWIDAEGKAASGCPEVGPEFWCGEFQPREDEIDAIVDASFKEKPNLALHLLVQCFARIAVFTEKRKRRGIRDEWLHEVLADVAKIIDLPAAVEAWKKEQER